MGLIKVTVEGIAVDRERDHPVVMLKSQEGDEVLPIWIGPAEATAIYTELAGSPLERPMTHDLLKLVVEELGGRVASIEITGIQKDTYFARIVIQRGEELFFIDARPSDSIALALRAGSSIYVDRELFENNKRSLQVGGGEDEKEHLEGLDPGESGDTDMEEDID